MHVEITFMPAAGLYCWKLWDGPADGSDHAMGYSATLRECVERIEQARERIAASYDWSDS